MQLIVTEGTDERFKHLCSKLDDYLNMIVGGEQQRTQYTKYNQLDSIHDVVLIIEDDKAVGCGSFKKYDDQTAELKRVYVSEEYRGKRYGRVILEQLESIAKNKGYKSLILETGRPLEQAKNLYTNMGYKIIDNYGQYVDMKDSICMEKIL